MTKMLATTFAVIALPTLAAAEWQVDTEISPVDDSQTVKLSTPALDQFVNDFGQLIRPVLVTACQEGEMVTYVYWDTF